jgi:hypothetical protein
LSWIEANSMKDEAMHEGDNALVLKWIYEI